MPSPTSDARDAYSSATASRTKVALLLVAFGSLTLLAADRLNATFSVWSRPVPLDLAHAQLDRQGVYRSQLTVPVDPGRIFPSRIWLLDADQDRFFYTPSINSLYTVGRGLFTIQKKNSLLFTLPSADKELPTKDGAVLILPVLFPSWATSAFLLLLCLSSAALFCCVPFPTRRWKVLASRFIAVSRWCLESIGAHPLVVLSLPSAYLLAVYPCL
jgi:hypothetical protein